MLSQIKTGVFSEFCAEAPLKGMRPAAVLCLLIQITFETLFLINFLLDHFRLK